MYVEVEVPGSCGELMQGTEGGVPFLITCPVNKYTRVVASDKLKGIEGLGEKAMQALQKTLALFDIAEYKYGLRLESELPLGKGMASSSADIAAVCLAVAHSLGKDITETDIANIATEIEPTDGIFFAGVVKINHVSGQCLQEYGALAHLPIAVFDTGGVVDTLQFHERRDLSLLNLHNENRIRQGLQRIENKGEQDIAQAATCSALTNQNILYKEKLDEIAATAQALGAIGINVAHSGTVLGVIFAASTPQEKIERAIRGIQNDFSKLEYLYMTELIPGGYSIKIEE